MSTIRFSDAITALLAAYSAAAPLAGVTITDGPQPSALAVTDFVIVGHDGTLGDDGALSNVTEAGSSQQEWMAMPALRDESGTVNCVACSQTGDGNDLAARRARAQALVAACEDAAIGAGVVGGIVFDGTVEVHFLSRQTPNGVSAFAAFTVGYSAPF